MAESESGQDKTEDPTEKRKRDAREKGEIARSKELNTVAVTTAGAGGLLAFGGHLAETLLEMMRMNFSLTRDIIVDDRAMGAFLLASGKMAIWATQPVLILLFVISFVAPIALSGFLFSGSLLQPKFSRMNPLSGIKRMFSMHALTELLKALAKFFVIWWWPWWSGQRPPGLAVDCQRAAGAGDHPQPAGGWLECAVDVGRAAADCCGGRAVPAVADAQENEDDQAGSARRVQGQRGQARGQAAYSPATARGVAAAHDGGGAAGRCDHHQPDALCGGPAVRPGEGWGGAVAAGQGYRLHGPEDSRNRCGAQDPDPRIAGLARAIYYSTELEQEIPAGLYLAVAQVLAYVFQIRQYRAGKGKRPEPLKDDLPIPPDLRRDS